MDDLISRETVRETLQMYIPGFKWDTIDKIVDMMPSAQPEERTEERTETHTCDCISRQAAIDALGEDPLVWDDESEWEAASRNQWEIDVNAIRSLPSAQPEIIRCKNCTWWSNDEYRECSSPNYDNVHVTPAGFYCGWAERRTDA